MQLRRFALLSCLLAALIATQSAPFTNHTKQSVRAAAPAQIESVDLQSGPDFSNLIFLGDSITAGHQSGALFRDGQVTGYAALLSKQINSKIVMPFITNPGLPPNGQFTLTKPICQSAFPVGFLNLAPVPGAGTRANPTEQATDLAVSGQTVGDLISLKPKPITDPTKANLTDILLGLPGALANPPVLLTQLEWAEAMKPTTLIIWIGNNDALGAVGGGSDKLLTPLADFTSRYTELMKRAKATGAKNIFVSNIPDVTSIALLLSQNDVATISGQNKETLQFIFGIGKKDFVLPTALSLLPQGKPLPDNVVLTKKEIKNIKAAVVNYNKVIAEQAAANGATLVDMNKLFTTVSQTGVTIDGVGKVTTRPFGGAFSLDFVHPSATGYAIAANEFIKAINAKGATIPSIDLKTIALTDPLVCKAGGAAEGIQEMRLEDFERLTPMIERNLRVLTDPNYPILTDDPSLR